MTVFYLKFLITPTLMLAISLAAKRWGAHIGGLLSGLPVTSALVMLFLSLEQGPGFALQAIPGALAGLAAVQATYLFYYQITKRSKALIGSIAALLVYALSAVLISHVGKVSVSVALTLLLLSVIIAVTTKPSHSGQSKVVSLPRWVIPMRMLTATALLLVITACAQWLGPVLSGLLAPIPIIAWPLAVFAHVQGGHDELGAIVRGNAIGALGVLGFYLAINMTIVPWGTVPAIAAAVVLAVVATFAVAKLLQRR